MAGVVSQIEFPINNTPTLIDVHDSRLLQDSEIVIVGEEITSSSTHSQIPTAKSAYELMKKLEEIGG